MAPFLPPTGVAAAYAVLSTARTALSTTTMMASRTLALHLTASTNRNEATISSVPITTAASAADQGGPLHIQRASVATEAKKEKTSLSSFFSTRPNSRQFASLPNLFASLPKPTQPLTLPPPAPHPTNPMQRMKPTYALTVSYDGRRYPGGYEHNPHLDVPTVRGTITDRIRSVLDDIGDEASPNGSDGKEGGGGGADTNRRRTAAKVAPNLRVATAGRTDAGVSAKSNLFSFFAHAEVDTVRLKAGLNERSDDGDLVVDTVARVHSSFHATFGTTAREYIYVLPLMAERSGRYGARAASAADQLLAPLVGVSTDYRGMSSGKLSSKNTVCTLLVARCWHYDSDGRCTNRDEEEEDGVVAGFGAAWREYAVANLLLTSPEDAGSGADDHGAANGDDDSGEVLSGECLVFKLKADRFIRRMIRKIVNSVLREAEVVVASGVDVASADGDDFPPETGGWTDRWRMWVKSGDRTDNDPAPPGGLCFWRAEI